MKVANYNVPDFRLVLSQSPERRINLIFGVSIRVEDVNS